MIRRTPLIPLAAILLTTVGAMYVGLVPQARAAGEALPPTVPVDRPLPLVRSGQAVEAYVAEAMRPLRRADLTGEGLTADTIALDINWARARARAAFLGRIYRFDLNGDGRITRSEVMQSVADQRNLDPNRTTTVRRMVEREMRADVDGDRVITFDEARAHGDTLGSRETRRLQGLMQLDANGDGRVTPAEVEALARAEFAKADTDGNGLIGREEFRTLRASDRQQRLEQAGQGSAGDDPIAEVPQSPAPEDPPASLPPAVPPVGGPAAAP